MGGKPLRVVKDEATQSADCQETSAPGRQTAATDELPPWFVGARDISWQNRIMTQAIMQKHVDTGISSTVNLPNDATRQDVAGLYLMAWKMGLKGVTIFRDGCKRFPILSADASPGEKKNGALQAREAGNECPASVAQGAPEDVTASGLPRGYIIDVSDGLAGKNRKLTSGCGSLHVTAFFDPNTGDLMETLSHDDFASISDELAEKFTKKIYWPEVFARIGDHVIWFKDQPGAKPQILF